MGNSTDAKGNDTTHPHAEDDAPHPCQHLHYHVPCVHVRYVGQRLYRLIHHHLPDVSHSHSPSVALPNRLQRSAVHTPPERCSRGAVPRTPHHTDGRGFRRSVDYSIVKLLDILQFNALPWIHGESPFPMRVQPHCSTASPVGRLGGQLPAHSPRRF